MRAAVDFIFYALLGAVIIGVLAVVMAGIGGCGFWQQQPVCPPSDPQCYEPRPWEVFTPQPGLARDSGRD